MGSGFLALPYAFTELGVGVGTAVLVGVTLIAFATAMYTLEVMAGAEAIVRRAYTLAGRVDAAEQGGEPTPKLTAAGTPPCASPDRSRLQSSATRESCDSLNTVPLSDSDSTGILGPPAVHRAPPASRSLTSLPHGRDRSNSAGYGAVATHSLLGPAATHSLMAGDDSPHKAGLPPDKATVRRTCPMCKPSVAIVRACCGLRLAAKAASACSEESHTVTVPLAAAGDPVAHPYLRITQRKFELVELVGMFMGGVPARRVYTLLVSAYLTGTTWGYGTVFGHACAEHLSLPFLHSKTANYQAYVLLFAVVVLAMACFDLREQKLVQQLMTGFRVLVMGVMVISILVGALNHGTGPWPELDFTAEGGGLVPHAPVCATAGSNGTSTCDNHGYMSFGQEQIAVGVAGITLQAVARSAPIILYSVLLHPAVPVLAQPVKSKTRLFTAYGWTYTITTTAYTLLASSGSLFFGPAMSQSANLNWASFGKGTGLEALAYLVVLFPALDVVTITSVTVIALASNFMASWYGPAVAKVENSSWMTVVAFRMAGGVPPMIGALLVSDFASVLDFTGVVGFLVAFVVPPWLWLNMTYSVNCIWSTDGGRSSGIRPGWHVHQEADGDAQVSDKPSPDGSLEVSDAFASCQHAWFAVRHWQCSRRHTGATGALGPDETADTPLVRARVTQGSPAAQSPYVGPWSTPYIAWPILWFGLCAVLFVMLVLTGAV